MLEAKQISLVIGGTTLLDQVSLQVVPGQLLAVLGPNGAGKSSLLKTLAGELTPSSGQIVLQHQRLQDWSRMDVGRLRAVLPQQAHIAFAMTVIDVVTYGRFPHCQGIFSAHDKQIAHAMLRKMDVAHLAGRDFNSLSGGEKNRVQLARVFAQIDCADAHQARYLLLDEPTAALDLPHQHHLLQQARLLAQNSHVGVLIILHDINLAARYAHRIAYLRNGRKLDEGPVAAMMDADKIFACFGIKNMIIKHPVQGWPMMIV